MISIRRLFFTPNVKLKYAQNADNHLMSKIKTLIFCSYKQCTSANYSRPVFVLHKQKLRIKA